MDDRVPLGVAAGPLIDQGSDTHGHDIEDPLSGTSAHLPHNHTFPASPFVADFVGQADFIPGTVRNGSVVTEIGEFPNRAGYRDGTPVVVMIRPDDIHVVPAKEREARILGRQFRGSENLYTIGLPSGLVVHSSEASTSVYPVGTPVELRVIATHTVLFELEQGSALSAYTGGPTSRLGERRTHGT